jgi:signal-transduction protein with cAMP-binding, CBS, and nucleotidyltransferase domain
MQACGTKPAHSPVLAYREDDILQNLPPRMHAEVKQHANRDTVNLLRDMQLFEGLDMNLLNKLIVALRTQFLPPGELVCAEGEVGRHLYIIRKGTVEVCKSISTHAVLVQQWRMSHIVAAIAAKCPA